MSRNDNLISVIENGGFIAHDSVCRLYEVGKRRPNDSDSDAEQEISDDEEGSESSETSSDSSEGSDNFSADGGDQFWISSEGESFSEEGGLLSEQEEGSSEGQQF